jgi:hypothetical protein
LAAPTNGSESGGRAFAVRQAGGFRGLSAGGASGAPGLGRDGAAPGDVFQGKTVATVLLGG